MAVRGKGRPSVADAEAIDRAIRDAAIGLLIRDGAGVTINAVAEASGLSRKSVYARFANKDALLVAVIRDMLANNVPVTFASGGSFEERLAAYARVVLRTMRAPAAFALQRLLNTNPDYPKRLGQDIVATVDYNLAEPLRGMLAEAEASGEVRIADPAMLVRTIVTIVLSEGSRMFRERDARPADAAQEAQEAVFARFVAALVAQGVTPR